MKESLKAAIEYAVTEAAGSMAMDKEHSIRFVLKNVPNCSEDDASLAVTRYIDRTRYHVIWH